MADDNKVEVGVHSKKTGTGFEDTAKAAKEAGDAAKEAGQKAKESSENWVELGEQLRTIVEAVGLIEFLRESVQEFYEQEKALRSVSAAALVWGGNQDEAKRKADEFAVSLSQLSGVADNELAAAIGKAYIATGDLGEGMRRVKLATDIMSGGGAPDFAAAMKIVEQAVNGTGREVKNLVPEVKAARDVHEFATIAVAGLEKRFGGLTESVNDNAKASDIAHAKWQQFQQHIGSAVLPAINWVREALSDVVIWIEKWSQKTGIWFDDLMQHLDIFGKTISLVLHGKFTEANEYVAGALLKLGKQTAENMAAIDADFLDKKKKNEAELLKVVAEGAAGQVQINKDLQEKKTKDEKAHYTHVQSDTKQFLKDWALFQKNKALMAKQTDDEILAHFGFASKKQMEIEAETAARTAEILRHTLALKKKAAKLELEMQMEVANAGLGLLTDVFGQSKELSIAQAIISTYEGATKALAQGGIYGAVLAAIVIAAGLAQVAKIESTEPATTGVTTAGAGFDDPSNDAAARQGGRRWANDMIREFTTGVSAGWSEGMRGSSVNNDNRRTYNVTYSSGGPQDPTSVESLKRLVRNLKMADMQVNGQATIARPR